MGRPSRDRLLFLRRHSDIERVKRNGRRFETPLFNLVSHPSSSSQSQIGIVVGKRLGTAVVRNRTKRIFRALARQTRLELVDGRHVLVFPKRKVLTTRHEELRRTWRAALHHEGLLRPEDLTPRTTSEEPPLQPCDGSVSV